MSQSRSGVFSTLQKIGQSLMVPVSVLPAAGLLVALGRMIQKGAEGPSGEITNALLHGIGNLFFTGGLAIFEQLPVVFAIGVAIGFTGGAGVAGLASVAGYFTLINVLKAMGEFRGLALAINTGVFGGIIVGLMSASLYNRFFQTKLHPVFGFFAGKRLVPIVATASAIVLGVVLGFVWPPIQEQINHFGAFVMGSDLGPAFYAAGKRLLIPVGLHHVYYPPFLYQFGEFTTAAGKVLTGDSARYFAGDPSAGRFMAAEYPLMLFGLPAATLAMYLRAPAAKRTAVAGIMLSAALTSIITGITEPIEFAFIFVAPVLFVFHVIAAFVSGLLTGYLDIHLGYTFSASVIDFALGFFNQKNSLWLFVLVGPAIGAAYFLVFYWAIGMWDLKTPGREPADASAGEPGGGVAPGEKAMEVLKAIGNKGNVVALDACITRLRLTVKDASKVDQARLKQLGAAGVMNAGGGNVQIVFGVEADALKDQINRIIAAGGAAEPEVEVAGVVLRSPLVGKVVALEQVPDENFSQKMSGDGVAIDPTEGAVYAPVDGQIGMVFRTNHALGLVTDTGVEILIHVGIDTVKMKGHGFKALVKAGDQVRAGQKLLEFDLELVRKEAKSTITPVLITNVGQFKGLDVLKQGGSVGTSDSLLKVRT